MTNIFKFSTVVAAIFIAQGCTQGPDIGKIDDSSMRYLGSSKVDIYTLDSSAIEDWAEAKADFKQRMEEVTGTKDLSDAKAFVEAVDDLIDEMDLADLVDDVKPFNLVEAKAKLKATYQAQLDNELAQLAASKAEKDSFLPTYNESFAAFEKGRSDIESFKSQRVALNDAFQLAKTEAIKSLADVGVDSTGNISKRLGNDRFYNTYSYNFTEALKDKTCRDLDRNAGNKPNAIYYSDARITDDKSELVCTKITFPSSYASDNAQNQKLKEPQINAIKLALNKAQSYLRDGNQLIKQSNSYYQDHPQIADLHNRYQRNDRRMLESLETKVKWAQDAVDRVIIPSDEKIANEVAFEHMRTLNLYSEFHYNNILLNQLDYVSTVSADGRFKLDNSEKFNLLIARPERKINQKAAYKIIRLAEFDDKALVTIGLNDILTSKEFQTITL
ncbi:hypothetical protein ACROAE_11575 [Shewanella sp. MF05960]|uniref:hypothetical protein n=1 Tax=Shewanella sp. MF05960 TaxID=3434874 RepID=UPI003D7AB354